MGSSWGHWVDFDTILSWVSSFGVTWMTQDLNIHISHVKEIVLGFIKLKNSVCGQRKLDFHIVPKGGTLKLYLSLAQLPLVKMT